MSKRFLLLSSCLIIGLVSEKCNAVEVPHFVLNSPGHTHSIVRCRFLPNGREVVTISRDKTLRVWDLASGAVLRVVRLPIGNGSEGELLALAVSSDGDVAVVAGFGPDKLGGGQISIVSLRTGSLERVLVGHKGFVFGVAISPNGTLIASAGEDKTARIWDAKTGKELRLLDNHTDYVYSVGFSPDGKTLATTSFDKCLALWDVETGRIKQRNEGHKDWVRAVDWSPNGELLATASWDSTIRLWTADGLYLSTIENQGLPAMGVRFTADSKKIAVISSNSSRAPNARISKTSCRIFDISSSKQIAVSAEYDGTLNDVDISPNGKLLAVSGGVSGEVRFLNAITGEKIRESLIPDSSRVIVVGWNADASAIYWGGIGDVAASTIEDRAFEYKFQSDTLDISKIDKYTDKVVRNRFRDDFSNGIKLSKSNSASAAYVRNGELISNITLPTKDDVFRSRPSLSPDNSLVVVGSDLGLWVFSTSTGKLLHSLVGHSSSVHDAVFSADGKYIVSGGSDRTVRVWKVNRELPLVSLFVTGNDWIAWTTEGYYAASPGGEKLVGWQINNGLTKTPTFHPAERFHDSLYRPDVIKLLLKHGNLEDALQEADKVRGTRETKKLNVAKVEPPRVVFVKKPRPDLDGKIRVEVEATSPGGQGITNLRLLVNDRPYAGAKADRPKSGTRSTETAVWPDVLLLPDKFNRIKVQAETSDSRGMSDELTVFYAGEAKQSKPKLHVLNVAVSEYQSPLIRQLRFSGKGANRLVETFVGHSKPSLFDEVSPISLRDKQATKIGILEAFDQLAKSSTDVDTVVVYLSGHGTRSIENPDQWLFCPVEFDLKKQTETGLSDLEIRKKLDAIRADRLLVLLDACNSGASIRTLKQEGSDIDLLCSSLADQNSQERGAPLNLPLFTAAVCEGLASPKLAIPTIPGDDLAGVPFGTVAEKVRIELHTETQRLQTPQYHPAARGPLFLTNPK